MNISSVEPIEKTTSFMQVVRRIEDLLRNGTLKPSQKLPGEVELAKSLQVSRPTLREALKALGLLGFIVSRPGQGTYVANGNHDLFRNTVYYATLLENTNYTAVIEARMAIEPFLAERAASRANEADLDTMRRCLAKMEAGLGSTEKYPEGEVAFHEAIAVAASSPLLYSILDALGDLLVKARREITADANDRANFMLHRRIFEAIEARDSVLAQQRMREHMADNELRYRDYYRR